MSAKERANALKSALTQKQLTQLAAAQGATASGKLSTLVDTAQQTLGRVTAPLFAKLVGYLEKINKWLDANQAKVKELASVVGGVLVTALEAVVEAIKFLSENKGLAIFLGVIAGGLLLIASPLALTIAGFTLLVLAIKKLGPVLEAIKNAAASALGWMDDKLIELGGAIADLASTIAEPFILAWHAVETAFNAVFGAIKGALAGW
jgi:hypothetical protein